ncbi:MAG: hypothetical protein ACLQNE_46410 [Thermoguttaceae bacterium]
MRDYSSLDAPDVPDPVPQPAANPKSGRRPAAARNPSETRDVPRVVARVPDLNDEPEYDEEPSETEVPGIWRRCLRSQLSYQALAAWGVILLVVAVAIVAGQRSKKETASKDFGTREGPAPNAPMAPRWTGTSADSSNWQSGAPNSGPAGTESATSPPNIEIPTGSTRAPAETATAATPDGSYAAWNGGLAANEQGMPDWRTQPYPNTAEKQALPPSWSDRGPETGYAAQQTAPRRDLGRPQTAADSTSAAFYDDRAPAGNTNRVSYNDYQNKDYPPSSSDAAGQRRYGSSYDTAPPASYSCPSRSSYAANPDTTGDYRAANGYPPNRDLPADNRTAARPPSSYDLQYGNRSSYPANDASTGPALPSPAPAYSAPSSTAYPPRDDRAAPAWSGSGAYAP